MPEYFPRNIYFKILTRWCSNGILDTYGLDNELASSDCLEFTTPIYALSEALEECTDCSLVWVTFNSALFV